MRIDIIAMSPALHRPAVEIVDGVIDGLCQHRRYRSLASRRSWTAIQADYIAMERAEHPDATQQTQQLF